VYTLSILAVLRQTGLNESENAVTKEEYSRRCGKRKIVQVERKRAGNAA